MRKFIEEILSKNEDFQNLRNGRSWWKTSLEGALIAYDKYSPDKEFLLGDPLSRETRISKRNILIFSAFLILVSIYGIETKDAKILNIGFQVNENYILPGAFGLVAVYMLTSFVFHYFRDVLALFKAKQGILHESLVYPFFLVINQMIKLKNTKEQGENIVDQVSPSTQAFIESTEEHGDFIKLVVKNYSSIKLMTSLNYLRFFLETVIWDFILPMSLGAIAVYNSLPAIDQVLSDVFK